MSEKRSIARPNDSVFFTKAIKAGGGVEKNETPTVMIGRRKRTNVNGEVDGRNSPRTTHATEHCWHPCISKCSENSTINLLCFRQTNPSTDSRFVATSKGSRSEYPLLFLTLRHFGIR